MTRAAEGESAPPAFLLPAVVIIGATALIAQVVLTRELLVLFFGNELSIALVLAVWLVSVAAGSAAGAWVAAYRTTTPRALAWSQLAMAVLLPASIAVARWSTPAGVPPGEVLGPGDMLQASLVSLAAVAALSGFQFVLAARAASEGRWRVWNQAVSLIAAVYALEAAGAFAGGVLFHLYLAEHLLPLQMAFLFAVLNLLSANAILRPRWGPVGIAQVLLSLLLAGSFLWIGVLGERAEIAVLSARGRWKALRPVTFVPSRYGALVVTQRSGQTAFYQNGVLLGTSQDDYASEVVAHLPLLEHPHPRRVLVIGGATSGLVGEVLKHPVDRVDSVELDGRLIELARDWLPPSLVKPLDDPRVHLHVGDGRLFLRKSKAAFDVVLLNLPDPTTAALNRFYTEEFLGEVRRALAPGGLVCLALTGSEVHLSGSVLLAAATLVHALDRTFLDHLLIPGDRMLFISAQRSGVLTTSWQELAQRLADRRITARFVNEAWLQDALLPLRRDMIEDAIAGVTGLRPNTDLNPVSYHYQTRIWLEQSSSPLAAPARRLSRASPWWVLPPLILGGVLLSLVGGRRRGGMTVIAAAAAIGGFGLVLELLIALVFQSACGYLYHALGLLIAAFMAGLALGSAAMIGRTGSTVHFGRLLVVGLATAALASALMPNLLRTIVLLPQIAAIALPLLLLLTGSLVGALFPVAVALYRRQQPAAAGGMVYAADLLGSAGAALIVGSVAIPLLGVSGTAVATALVLAVAVVFAAPLWAANGIPKP